MTKIGKNFPKTQEARKSKLSEILETTDSITKMKVPGHNMVDVYRIPLEYLSYNPYNTRFLAEAKTLETRAGRKLDDENPEDIIEIEKFIWNHKIDKNESTINSLIKEGQLQPGVVTKEGVILSGNRRFRLLNEIQRNYEKYAKPGINLDGLQFFEAAILKEELSEKDIRKYESFYQYGNEEKVEYEPIQKYLAASEQKKLGYDEKEIADNFAVLTNGKRSVVVDWLRRYKLMEEYLDYIEEPNIYTALESREEAFINLEKTLKSYNNGKEGKIAWAFSSIDIERLKCVYFAYIWLGMPTHDFRDFKKIFNNEKRWKNFHKNVKEEMENSNLESLEEYREKNEEKSESEISTIRENDFKKKCANRLKKLYGEEKATIISQEIEETPNKIIEQISEKLDKLEETIAATNLEISEERDSFVENIRKIMKKIGKIKQRLD